MRRDLEKLLVNIIFVICVVLSVGVLLFGVVRTKIKEKSIESVKKTFTPSYDDEEVYHLNEKTTVNFYDPIIEQFNKESQLVVSSADASIELNLKQTGVFDVGLLNKTQKITYKGTGRFYVDMSDLSQDNIDVDEENKTVTIFVPHTKLLPIEIDPNRFESEDAKKGLLAFGDLKFTPKEYNDLQTEVKTKLEKRINVKENRLKADDNAISEITKIYEPIVKSLDEEYSVQVSFVESLGGIE